MKGVPNLARLSVVPAIPPNLTHSSATPCAHHGIPLCASGTKPGRTNPCPGTAQAGMHPTWLLSRNRIYLRWEEICRSMRVALAVSDAVGNGHCRSAYVDQRRDSLQSMMARFVKNVTGTNNTRCFK